MKPLPSYAPVYAAALYPGLATIAREHGYALAVHGSLQRDFDLVAVPWTEAAAAPDEFVAAIVGRYAVRVIGEPTAKPHGRVAYALAVDLSFMPRTAA